MMGDTFRINIEMVDNGYVVEIPDLDEIAKKKKEMAGSKGADSMYLGDCTEKRVAKSAGEVLSIVKYALANLPEAEYSDAFDEASKEESK